MYLLYFIRISCFYYTYRFLSFDYRRKRKSERRDEWKHNNELPSSRGRPLLARKESAAFIKHRQNDISVSLFPFRDFNESNQRAARGGWGRGVFHRVRRFNSPGRVLRARATLESGLTLEDPRLGYDRPAFDVCALAHARAITRGSRIHTCARKETRTENENEKERNRETSDLHLPSFSSFLPLSLFLLSRSVARSLSLRLRAEFLK